MQRETVLHLVFRNKIVMHFEHDLADRGARGVSEELRDGSKFGSLDVDLEHIYVFMAQSGCNVS